MNGKEALVKAMLHSILGNPGMPGMPGGLDEEMMGSLFEGMPMSLKKVRKPANLIAAEAKISGKKAEAQHLLGAVEAFTEEIEEVEIAAREQQEADAETIDELRQQLRETRSQLQNAEMFRHEIQAARENLRLNYQAKCEETATLQRKLSSAEKILAQPNGKKPANLLKELRELLNVIPGNELPPGAETPE